MASLAPPPLIEARNVCKRFPGVRALHHVDLAVGRGEVLALLGENGAGKSTLMKVLAGILRPDSGQLFLDGGPRRLESVRAAVACGIALIHQELNLVGNLNVGANVFLGREPHRLGIVDRRTIRRESAAVLRVVGLDVSPDTPLDQLPIGQQQLVEIAKALSVQARLIIMDEPTSSLSAKETQTLFQVVRDLRARGVSVVYISHRLGEIRELADRVVVLRDGQNAGQLQRGEIEHDRMVRLMVGREISQFYRRRPPSAARTQAQGQATRSATQASEQPPAIGVSRSSPGQLGHADPILEAVELATAAHPAHRLNFRLNRGEIVGLAGLVGAGRTELLQTLFGVAPAVSGQLRVAGRAVDFRRPADAIRAGIALVPEDRKQQGLIVDMTVQQNVSLAGLSRHSVGPGILRHRHERELALDMIQKLRIRTPTAVQAVRNLSGGNQQKVVLGKWLSMQPRVLLLDEPTRGIDVGAKEEIYALMESLAESGVAIFFVSSELEEIMGMSDRVLVMHEGRLGGQLLRAELSEQAIMSLATGATPRP
jgi:ribose transport system ATP-binding protein